jgi:hypothetical protein
MGCGATTTKQREHSRKGLGVGAHEARGGSKGNGGRCTAALLCRWCRRRHRSSSSRRRHGCCLGCRCRYWCWCWCRLHGLLRGSHARDIRLSQGHSSRRVLARQGCRGAGAAAPAASISPRPGRRLPSRAALRAVAGVARGAGDVVLLQDGLHGGGLRGWPRHQLPHHLETGHGGRGSEAHRYGLPHSIARHGRQ